MTDVELLEFSNDQKKTASKILDDSDLLKLLSNYGKCTVIGSMYLDLMYGPDIDIVVETDNPRESSIKVLKELVDGRQFQKYQYGDFEKFPREGRPIGFIIVLISEINGIKWETEIWFVVKYPQEKFDRDLGYKNRLTSIKRLEILKQKQAREKRGDDKNTLSSVDIYKSVLE